MPRQRRPPEKLSIDLAVSPEPLKAGPATLTATVKSADGQPMADAAVTVVFAMAGDAVDEHAGDASRGDAQPAAGGGYRGIDRRADGRPVGRHGHGDPWRRPSRVAAADASSCARRQP